MFDLGRPAFNFLLGGLAALGLAPVGLWPITLLAMILFFCGSVRDDKALRDIVWAAWWFGFGYFSIGLNWIVEPFLVDIKTQGWIAPFALVFLVGGLALFWALGAWIGLKLHRSALSVGVGLSVMELARGYVLTGFPWALPGYIWTETPVAQGAAWIGVYGLTMVTFWACALASDMIRWRGSILAMSLSALVLGGVWCMGSLRFAQDHERQASGQIRLVQPNAAQHEKWDPNHTEKFFQRMLDYTAAEPKPEIVIWPRSALTLPLEMADHLIDQMRRSARGVPVLFGALRYSEGQYYNSLIFMSSQGVVTPIYDKHHLVPFGEYLPFEPWLTQFGLGALADQFGGSFGTGAGPNVITVEGLGDILPLICYEALFPQGGLNLDVRPSYLVHVTNDAWFGRFFGPQQHLQKAQMRAIEFGLPLVRSANTGISASIDAYGRVVSDLPLNTAGYLDVEIQTPLLITHYARFGHIINLIMVLVGLTLVIVLGRGRQKVDLRSK